MLNKISENVFYIAGRTNIGVITLSKNECIIIDSGIDEDYGRKILKVLSSNNLKIKALINTHAHADHIGGNKIIYERTKMKIYSSLGEKPFIEKPLLEPLYIYGAYPPKMLRSKLFMAEPTPIHEILENSFNDLKIIKLPGHSLDMIGIIYENVAFIADALFSKEILEKHLIPYHLNVKQALETIENLKKLKNLIYLPSHGVPTKNIEELIEINTSAIMKLKNFIIEELRISPKSIDELTKIIIQKTSNKINNVGQYFLIKSALLSYISWFDEENVIEISIIDNVPIISLK
jgi:glyoxylase-like metal-dependent hydrolase (beta-lactamase superfamily II)